MNPALEDRAYAAGRIGVTDAMLKKIENGERRPSFETLEAMAAQYGVMIGDLFPSSAIRGGEIGRLVAPMLTLDPPVRARLMAQLESFAEFLAGTVNHYRDRATDERHEERREQPPPSFEDRPAAPLGLG